MGFLAAALSASRRQVRREWSLQDYLDQLEYWNKVPPPHISLALIARAHGAKFDGGSSGSARPDRIQEADPEALQAFLGQAEPVPYRPPRMGLPVK